MTGQRSSLARRALEKALEVRDDTGFDSKSPLCVYSLCDRLGIKVQFVEIGSMEGMYVAKPEPRILLSALRPLTRKVFSAAHELGHHLFGHGMSVDELKDEATSKRAFDPDEFLVDSFAGYLLMPKVGVQKAFVIRGWRAETATPGQLFAVACNFGVGYETLINHMAYGLRLVDHARAQSLLRTKLPAIRQSLLGAPSSDRLIMVDEHHMMPTLDAEAGTLILAPAGAEPESTGLTPIGVHAAGRLFRAEQPGIVRLQAPATGWAILVRTSRHQYVGLSKYRHIEETDDE